MHIVEISTFPPDKCGIGTYCNEYLHSLMSYYPFSDDLNIDIITYTHDIEGKPIHYSNNGFKIHPVINRTDPRWCYKLLTTVLNLNPDILDIQHEYGLFPGENWLRFLNNTSGKFPVVITYHSIYSDITEKEKSILTESLSQSTTFVHHKYQKRTLQQNLNIPSKDIYVAPHGAREDINFDTEECKKALNLEDCFVIGEATWIQNNKGLPELVERIWPLAYPKLKEVVKNPILFIAGNYRDPNDKFYTERLEELITTSPIKDTIIFRKDILPSEGDDIYKVISAFDIALIPTTRESQSGTEARVRACKKPLVANGIEGISAQIEASRTGIAVPPITFNGDRWSELNSYAFTDAIIYLAANPNLREQMSKNAALDLRTRSGWSRIAEKKARVYKQILTKLS